MLAKICEVHTRVCPNNDPSHNGDCQARILSDMDSMVSGLSVCSISVAFCCDLITPPSSSSWSPGAGRGGHSLHFKFGPYCKKGNVFRCQMTFMWSSAQNYLKIIYHPDVSQDLLGTHTWPLSNLVIRRRGRGAVIMAAAAAARPITRRRQAVV